MSQSLLSIKKEKHVLEYDNVIKIMGEHWKNPPRLHNRREMIRAKCNLINKYLPEYINHPPIKLLDMSCGTGPLMEIFRELGHEVMGFDRDSLPIWLNTPYLQSQGLPFIEWDGRNTPYPFADKSYDLVTNIGSINYYNYDNPDWESAFKEIFRIAKDCVFIVINKGPEQLQHIDFLNNWAVDGWHRKLNLDHSYFKWKYVG